MDLTKLAFLGVGAAAIIPFWNHFKLILDKIKSFFIVDIIIEYDAAIAVQSYCWNNFKCSKLGSKRFSSHSAFITKEGKEKSIVFEVAGKTPLVFWKGCSPIIVCSLTDSKENTYINYDKLKMTFFRGTLNIDDLLIEAMEDFNKIRNSTNIKRFKIYFKQGNGSIHSLKLEQNTLLTPSDSTFDKILMSNSCRILKYTIKDIGKIKKEINKSLFDIYYPDNILNKVNEINIWLKSEDFYKSKNIPWRRGWLLYGKPSTGKSTLVRNIAEEFDLPLFVFDLASMNNKDFKEIWNECLTYSPCIILFEDLERIFDKDKNIIGELGGGLSFDIILNAISGVYESNGILTMVTTNDISKIDKALGNIEDEQSSRPGRLDTIIEIKSLDYKTRLKIANNLIKNKEKALQLAETCNNHTVAQFQEKCASIALEEYWKDK